MTTASPAASADPPAPSTREALLDAAEDLLLTRGWNGFSYADLAARIGIRKASIHHHFPMKEDLGIAVLERGRERARRQRLHPDADPLERFERQVRHFERLLAEGDRVCIGGSLSVGFDALPERLRAAFNDVTEERQRWLEQMFRDGQAAGRFRVDALPAEQAALMAAALQGGLQLARILRRPAPFRQAVRQLRASVLT